MATPATAAGEQAPQLQQLPPAAQYRDLMAECQRFMTKIAELEVDRNEHVLVEETLKPLDPKRRAFRLVGEVLVERTVDEVLPSVTANKDHVRTYLRRQVSSGLTGQIIICITHVSPHPLLFFCHGVLFGNNMIVRLLVFSFSYYAFKNYIVGSHDSGIERPAFGTTKGGGGY
jgi:prefoldin subunit 2